MRHRTRKLTTGHSMKALLIHLLIRIMHGVHLKMIVKTISDKGILMIGMDKRGRFIFAVHDEENKFSFLIN